MNGDAGRLTSFKQGLPEKLEFYWSGFRTGLEQKNSEAVQLNVYWVVSSLRSRAVVQYLIDGDRHGFFESCYQGALAFDLGNRFIRAGMPHDPNLFSVTNRGFFETLLTFESDDAVRILQAMPDEMRDDDDPVRFLLVAFLMELAADYREGYEETIEMLRQAVRDGEDATVETALCESLSENDGDRFLDAMNQFLDKRLEEIARNEDVRIGEEYVSVEGLALRRLAASVGLDVTIDHRLTPADLQRDYPPTDTLSRGDVPVVGPEIEKAGYWDGWSPVESW